MGDGLVSSTLIEAVTSASGLDLSLTEQLVAYAEAKHPGADLSSLVLDMPGNMFILTPYFTFNFIALPDNFQTLVKEYYSRKCRVCKIQVQRNAICLLCGEVLCQKMKDNCCAD